MHCERSKLLGKQTNSLGHCFTLLLCCDNSSMDLLIQNGKTSNLNVLKIDHLKTAFLSIVPVAFCYLISLRVSQDYFFSRVVKNTQRFLFPAMCLIRTGRLSFSSNLESGTIKDASLFMAPSHTKTKKQNKNHFFKLPFLWQQRLSETQCWGGGWGWGL